MARWKLMAAHYLNVPGEEWEYVEQDRKTGRPRRYKFKVPRLLDPKDPTCWTSKWGSNDDEDGEIIVCHENKGQPGDITFFGNPTPDMVPVDDEAREISASFERVWSYKPETADASFSQSMIDKFQIEMAEIKVKPAEIPGLADLTSAIGQLVAQNAKLLEGRRV